MLQSLYKLFGATVPANDVSASDVSASVPSGAGSEDRSPVGAGSEDRYHEHPSPGLNRARQAQLQKDGASEYCSVWTADLAENGSAYYLLPADSTVNPMQKAMRHNPHAIQALRTLCEEHDVHYTQIARVRIGTAYFWVIFRTFETIDSYVIVPSRESCHTDVSNDEYSYSDEDDGECGESFGSYPPSNPMLMGHVRIGDDPDLRPY
jgi:hypothetical protein